MSAERGGLREAIGDVLAEALAVFIQHGVCDLQDPHDTKRFDEYLDTIFALLTQAQGFVEEEEWEERGFTSVPLYASPVASAPNTYNARDELDALAKAPPDGALEGVIGFDIHEAIWGPLGEDEAVRPEAWDAAAAVMDILRARASAPEEEREAALYRARCGWCGAYEGTVDPDEPCDGTVTTGPDGDPMLGGPHHFGVYEPVGASPVASAPAIKPHDCEEWAMEGIGCANCNPVARDLRASAPEEKLADVAGRMKAYGYDAETLRVLTDHILGGAEIPMPSAPEPYDASKEPIALNFLDNILDCWKMGGDALDRFMRAQRRQIEDVLASAPVWPEPGAPAPATKPPLGKIRPSAPEEEREPGWKPDPCGICGGKRVTIRGQYPGCEDRLVCPTCLQERIDIVRKTLDPNTYRAVRATLTKDQTDG